MNKTRLCELAGVQHLTENQQYKSADQMVAALMKDLRVLSKEIHAQKINWDRAHIINELDAIIKEYSDASIK